ncbi:MAG: hypothetical protein EXR84_01030 [Gammaproteobacteria bacterium]|nr:hypothetical protein [Gammaproteobacteria bacterium]
MERAPNQFKHFVYGVMIFITLGISFANETLSRIGIEGNRVAMFAIALLLAAILLSRDLLLVGIVFLGILALNLPETTLLQYHLDRDLLLAMIGAAVIMPSIYQMAAK